MVNQSLKFSREALETFESQIPTIDPSFATSTSNLEEEINPESSESLLTSASLKEAKSLQKRLVDLLSGTIQRLKI